MLQLLENSAARHPEYVAVVFAQTQLSYAELRQRVGALAANLAALGITKGDRVALILPNTPTYVMAFYALMQLGAVAVSISPGSQRSKLLHILNDAGAVAVISLDVFLPDPLLIADGTSASGLHWSAAWWDQRPSARHQRRWGGGAG